MEMNIWLYLIIILLLIVVLAAIAYNIKLNQIFYRLTKKNIRDSVQSKFLELTPSTQSLVDLAVEIWRLEKRLLKTAKNLSDEQNKAFQNSVAKLHRFLEKNDISVADYTDQKYNEGLNLDILSMEKGSNVAVSIIKETHEPAVMHKGQLIKKAKVVVLEK